MWQWTTAGSKKNIYLSHPNLLNCECGFPSNNFIMPNKRERYGSLQRTSLWPCPAWHWFGSIRTSSTFPEGYPVTNIWKPAKTRDQKHCQTLVVKQYWWSNSIYYIPPRRKNYRLAGTNKKQYHPWKRRKNQSTTPPSFCEFQPLVAFRKRGLHHFPEASIRGVLPNWSTWFRLAPVPRWTLSSVSQVWICQFHGCLDLLVWLWWQKVSKCEQHDSWPKWWFQIH